MGGLLFIIVLLVLILTGAIVPVLVFGGWAIVVVLALVLVGAIFVTLLRLAISPVTMIGEDIFDWIKDRRNRPPSSDDPDYPEYLAWIRGESWGGCQEWRDVKALLAVRRGLKKDTEPI